LTKQPFIQGVSRSRDLRILITVRSSFLLLLAAHAEAPWGNSLGHTRRELLALEATEEVRPPREVAGEAVVGYSIAVTAVCSRGVAGASVDIVEAGPVAGRPEEVAAAAAVEEVDGTFPDLEAAVVVLEPAEQTFADVAAGRRNKSSRRDPQVVT